MKSVDTLLRRAEHEALQGVELSGDIVDLGGEKYAHYLSHLKGNFNVTTVNLDADASPDVVHDLEQPLPFGDASFDHALLINVLEHIYGYRELLEEAARIVRAGGSITVVVPFLFPAHPSPKDFWRFSEDALTRTLTATGFSEVRVTALGSGVFAARYVMLDRLLPYPLRLVCAYTLRYLVRPVDSLFAAMGRAFKRQYRPEDYALGYLVTARR